MKDFLKKIDRKIFSAQTDFLCNDSASYKLNAVYELIILIDEKIEYIAANPSRANLHYRDDTDSKLVAGLRRSIGMTQTQLGEMIGVTRESVSRWEAGHGISMANKNKLKEIYLKQKGAKQ